MAAIFVELTRAETEAREASVLVNLGTVAWIEPGANGTSCIVFATGVPNECEGTVPLTLTVRESAQEIAVLAGVIRKTDRDAIAQAWAPPTMPTSYVIDRSGKLAHRQLGYHHGDAEKLRSAVEAALAGE